MRGHLPPEALAWTLAEPQHCIIVAAEIGPQRRQVIGRRFVRRVLLF